MNITVLFIHALKNGINLDKILACKKYVLKVKVQSNRQKKIRKKDRKRERERARERQKERDRVGIGLTDIFLVVKNPKITLRFLQLQTQFCNVKMCQKWSLNQTQVAC